VLASRPIIEELKEKLGNITVEHGLEDSAVRVNIGTLSVKQAIGSPRRQDFPLLQGKEVMIEAEFRGSYGQAFTDRPSIFTGSLRDVLGLSLGMNENRAIFIASLNALTSYLGLVTGTRHCLDEEPEECAAKMAQYLVAETGKAKVGLIGLQPAILDNLVRTFGADSIRCTDLNPDNIGAVKYGAEILDGKQKTTELIGWCDLVLATGSTIVNNTFDAIREQALARRKRLVLFGVTGLGAAALAGLKVLCFRGHNSKAKPNSSSRNGHRRPGNG
jgi:uncharacterized protein (DUF4213/DUF364 family)